MVTNEKVMHFNTKVLYSESKSVTLDIKYVAFEYVSVALKG